MATFSYSTALPPYKSPVTSGRLRTLYTDLKTHINTFNPQGWTLPNVAASQYQALLYNTGLAFSLSHVFRSDAAVNFSGAASLAQGDILYFNGTNLTRLGAGTSGQLLKTNGAGANPSWVSLSTPAAWTAQTGNFSIADKGRYHVNGGQTGTLFVASSVDSEFWIKPAIGQDFTTSNFTIARAGSESIANSAANFVCDVNGEYHFISNASGNWDVSVSPIGRS